MKFYLVNQENPHCSSLLKKLEDINEGQIIPMTEGELRLYYDSHNFLHVRTGKDDNLISEVEPGKSYIAVVDEGCENIDDIIKAQETLGITIAIVRKGS